MQGISNSLRQRLGARPQPETHPDTDVLTAYVEQVLPAGERAEVVLHLSECSYCREVVSLSLPEVQQQQVVLQVPSRARFWIPAFRLGAVAAMVVVAATLMIEKPWRTQPVHPAQVTEPAPTQQSAATQTPQPAPPTVNTEVTLAPTTATASKEVVESRGVRSAALPEVANPPKVAAPAPIRLGVAGGVPQSNVGGSAGLTLARPAMAAPAPPQPAKTEAAAKDAEQDFVNKEALREEKSEVDRLTDAGNLPPAPAPQDDKITRADRKAEFPAVKLGELPPRTMDVPVAPPKTSSTTPPAGDTNLAKSGFGYKLKSDLHNAVNAVKKAAMMRSGGGGSVSSFSSQRIGGSHLAEAAAAEPKVESGPQYRIGAYGVLMESTDYTHWHQAYSAQSSDLQLKVFVTSGDQIWAGGTNATLIHSWNAGVNWETLKVPDPGDITSITIDDGWQVKTSDGQTFVSQDHGKTWVPLQSDK